MCSLTVAGQQRDTLKLTITKIEKKLVPDTVYSIQSRIDTIAMQPIKADTSKMVRDINPQDLAKSKYDVKILGSVRVNSYYDFTGMESTEGFKPYEIPVGKEKIPGLSGVYIGARQTRFGLEGTGNTKVGSIKTYIEVDFASYASSLLRLRHAFAEWNFLKMGYTWTTFMDNAVMPTTVEFEGPNSSMSKRHGLVRFEKKLASQNIFGVSIESPTVDYYNPNDSVIDNASNQRNFDLAARYKYFNRWGHLQFANILRKIDFLQNNRMETQIGWGILVSTSVNINQKNKINAQYSVGNGIAYYYIGFTNKQLDAVYNPTSQTMDLKAIRGGFVSYSYTYNPQLIFSATAGLSKIKNEEFEPSDAFKSSQYYAVNGFYNPIETISLGMELTTGSRKNYNDQKGNASRISLLAKFDF
ncbi:MAG TPA: DcaP family trimeric outer membrane transporter [Draconibacterium sp.]|nr:DcaP family trimeric outer membrane transporter [Draconibacterium sp.]